MVFTATKDQIQTITLSIKGTKETNDQHSATTRDKTKVIAIVIQTSSSGKIITIVTKNNQIYKFSRLLREGM
jgi:translation initiation factor 1 (eIF-1/SUI1)